MKCPLEGERSINTTLRDWFKIKDGEGSCPEHSESKDAAEGTGLSTGRLPNSRSRVGVLRTHI